MKLWIDKRQTNLHVNVCCDEKRLTRFGHIAHFASHRKRKNGLFGTIYLAKTNHLSVVVHELVHVAMHFVAFHTDMKGYSRMSVKDQDNYTQEAVAYAVENMTKQYMEAVGR